MWKLHPTDLQQLKGAGGERFVQFVDRLIRAEAACGGLPQSAISTQLRVNIPDGGVDTSVSEAIPADRSGWFAVRTCWQFKSVEADSIDDKARKTKRNALQTEVNKPYIEELIKQGYGYRFCLLGDLSPSKTTAWESLLAAEVEAFAPGHRFHVSFTARTYWPGPSSFRRWLHGSATFQWGSISNRGRRIVAS